MIQNIIITVLWIWGFYCLFSPNMLLFKAGEFLWQHFHKNICKPLFGCPPCMSSIHGTLMYFYLFPEFKLFEWVLFCVSICGANYILKINLFED